MAPAVLNRPPPIADSNRNHDLSQTMQKFVRWCSTATLILPAVLPLAGQTSAAAGSDRGPGNEPVVTLEKFIASEKNLDPNYILPNDPNDALGFAMKPVETPRSLTVVSSEMISNLSLSNVTELSVIA